MGRRGRTSAPASGMRRGPAPASRAAPPPSRVPAQAAAPPSAPMVAQPQGSGLLGQMAATAGGVAIGHTIGHAVTGMFSGGSSEPAAVAAPAAPMAQQPMSAAAQPSGACAWEIKQFLECAQGQSDLTLCEGFNEAIRQCKMANGI